MTPIVVDWQITAKCTRNCLFCYGPVSDAELSTTDACRLIDVFAQFGVRVVGITGGEPLLREDMPLIFDYIKKKGMAICLSTNCDLYKEYRNLLLNNVDSFGIPLEAANERVHDILRGHGNYRAVLNALVDISENSNSKLRVSTVLTNINYANLSKTESLLVRFSNSIVHWKLYDLISYPDRSELNALLPKKIALLQSHISTLGRSLDPHKIIHDKQAMRNRSYFLITPVGDVFLPSLSADECNEESLGNLLTDPLNAVKRWRSLVDKTRYTAPCRCIYRCDTSLARKVGLRIGEQDA